jgi:hypothetical protein
VFQLAFVALFLRFVHLSHDIILYHMILVQYNLYTLNLIMVRWCSSSLSFLSFSASFTCQH